ncbi:hypothetical protein Tco_1435210 [Tanacetum coccineum]
MAPVKSPQMISTVKLLMLKKGEYTLWSMRIEQYITNTDYGFWQVIMNGDEPVQTTKDENGVETKAKSLWAAIKSRFSGVPVGPVFLLGLIALAVAAACAFRAKEMPSLISCRMAAKVMVGVFDVDVLLGSILSTQDNA